MARGKGGKRNQQSSSSSGTEEVFEQQPQSSITLETFSNEMVKLKKEPTAHLTAKISEATDDISHN